MMEMKYAKMGLWCCGGLFISFEFCPCGIGIVFVWVITYRNCVKVGDKVLFGKYSGTEVKVEGDDILVMREDDIMGVIEG